jgi:hypothetical protein
VSGDKISNADFAILKNPFYNTDDKTYQEYNVMMTGMETSLNKMYKMVNTMVGQREQLENLLTTLPTEEKFANLKKQGIELAKQMKAWDEDMVQRKSKAYDDVENFPNKFTANYMFLINQTESEIPRVNQSSIELRKELDAEWAKLEARGIDLLNNKLPAYNKNYGMPGLVLSGKNEKILFNTRSDHFIWPDFIHY